MTAENSFTDLALRNWKANIHRADAFFGELSEEQLQEAIAPGRNRLIYLWGHLTAFNDALFPLLGLPGKDFIQNSTRYLCQIQTERC